MVQKKSLQDQEDQHESALDIRGVGEWAALDRQETKKDGNLWRLAKFLGGGL